MEFERIRQGVHMPPFKLSALCSYGIAIVAVLVTGISAMRADERVEILPQATQTITLRTGISTTITTASPFKTVQVADEKIVGVVPQSDHTISLLPRAPGVTNIEILDGQFNRIATLNILVLEGRVGRIEVYNKTKLNSFTVYRCEEQNGCEYSSETTVQEPAALPQGYSKQEIDSKSRSTIGNPTLPPP
jgi:hypothetical protein